jgi:hypothetical protein
MRRLIAATAISALALAACAETSDRVTTAPQVPASLVAGTGDVGSGACSVSMGLGLGARVSDVIPGSPADGSLEIDDLILSIDGAVVASSEAVVDTIATSAVGADVAIEIERSGSRLTTTVTLGESPDAPGRPRLGVLVVTEEDRIAAADLAMASPSSELTRVVGIDGDLYGFDPARLVWSRLGIEAPAGGWIPIDGEVYWIATDTEQGTSTVVGALGSTGAPFDAGDWNLEVSLTSLGGNMLVGVDRINSETTRFEAAVLAVDPASGATRWIWQAQFEEGGILFPAFAFKEPGNERVLVVLTPPDDFSVATYVLLSESEDGRPQVEIPVGIPEEAVVIGWHDTGEILSVLGTISEIGLTNVDTGETRPGTLPLESVPNGLWPVGDGRHMLIDRAGLELVEVDGVGRRNITAGCNDFVVGDLGF